MMNVLGERRVASGPHGWLPILDFALAILRGNLRNLGMLAASLFTPLLLLLMFWLTSQAAGNSDVLMFLYPSVVGLTVMLGSQALAMRIATWRQLGVFRRLACTPVPTGRLLIGAALAQLVNSVLQALLVLLFGVLVLQLPLQWSGLPVALLTVTLGGSAFISYAVLLGSLLRKPEMVSVVYIFTLMPMYFLGGGLPGGLLPGVLEQLGSWLPTGALNRLLYPLLNSGTLPADAPQAFLVLGVWIVGLGLPAAIWFRVE